VNFIKTNKFPLVTTIASVTETLHLLDFNRNAQIDFIEWIHRGAVEIQNIENNDFGRLKELTEKYRDLPMDFADSCLVYLAEKLNLNTIATIGSVTSQFTALKGEENLKLSFLNHAISNEQTTRN